MDWIIEKLQIEETRIYRMINATPPTTWMGTKEEWNIKETQRSKDLHYAIEILRKVKQRASRVEHGIGAGVSNWVACSTSLPEHGDHVVTYTPKTEITEEQFRLIRYGSLKSGFPVGVTHWKHNKPPCC